MAQTKEQQRTSYPLPAYNFRVTVGGTAMSFAEVSGVTLEYGTVTYRHGLSFVEGEAIETYRTAAYAPIMLKRGTVSGVTHLHKWLLSKTARNVDISLCDETGQPVVTWHVAKALPTKLQAPLYAADTDEVAIETLEVMASDVSIEHHG